jgi:hypothetical protein
MFGSKRRELARQQHEQDLARFDALERMMRDVFDRLRKLEARPMPPVAEVNELRAAMANKINRAIEAHAHADGGNAGFPIKVE